MLVSPSMIFGFASDICQTKPKWPQLLRRQCYLMPNSTILARKSTSESIHCQSDSMWRWWQYKRNSRILDIKARCLFLNKPKETCRSFPILFLLSGAPSCVTNPEAVAAVWFSKHQLAITLTFIDVVGNIFHLGNIFHSPVKPYFNVQTMPIMRIMPIGSN